MSLPPVTALERWALAHGVRMHFIQPGKPGPNGHVESFNGHFRNERRSQGHWPTLARARFEAELGRVDYYGVRDERANSERRLARTMAAECALIVDVVRRVSSLPPIEH